MAFDTRIARSATVSLTAPPGHRDRADPGAGVGVSGSPRPRIAFFFNAQAHQLLHGITTAEALIAVMAIHILQTLVRRADEQLLDDVRKAAFDAIVTRVRIARQEG